MLSAKSALTHRIFNWRVALALLCLSAALPSFAQFRADFNDGGPIKRVTPTQAGGWSWYSGDGEATVDLLARDSYATFLVDGRRDRLNVWWAVARARIEETLDLRQLSQPGYELRIEARVRVSAAPRRINLQLSSDKTKLHEHLAEFDIPTAGEWHRLSFTTREFPAQPGEGVYLQVAMMDWGQALYATDIDSIEVAVVDAAQDLPAYGLPLTYHPEPPAIEDLPHTAIVEADTVIDHAHPWIAAHDWGVPADGGDRSRLLPVTPSQTVLLRWNFSDFADRAPRGPATLELTTHSLTRLLGDFEELGRVRVVEILADAPEWAETEATYESFTLGKKLSEVTNPQTIIDVAIDPDPGARNRIVISQPVMQRLLNGQSEGLALLALGPIHATFIARENAADEQAPLLRFALEGDPL